MVFLLTQCATSIVFCRQSKIKLLLVWKWLLLADTKCLLCLSFSNLLFMPKKEINSHFNILFNTVYETNVHWAVSVCSYCFCGFKHPRSLWDPVSFVCPGGKLSAGSVIQVMSTLPLGTCGPFRSGFCTEFHVELSNPQLLVTWMRPTKSIFLILFLF